MTTETLLCDCCRCHTVAMYSCENLRRPPIGTTSIAPILGFAAKRPTSAITATSPPIVDHALSRVHVGHVVRLVRNLGRWCVAAPAPAWNLILSSTRGADGCQSSSRSARDSDERRFAARLTLIVCAAVRTTLTLHTQIAKDQSGRVFRRRPMARSHRFSRIIHHIIEGPDSPSNRLSEFAGSGPNRGL